MPKWSRRTSITLAWLFAGHAIPCNMAQPAATAGAWSHCAPGWPISAAQTRVGRSGNEIVRHIHVPDCRAHGCARRSECARRSAISFLRLAFDFPGHKLLAIGAQVRQFADAANRSRGLADRPAVVDDQMVENGPVVDRQHFNQVELDLGGVLVFGQFQAA